MDLKEWIREEYLSEEWIAKAHADYADTKPYPHMHLAEFLVDEKYMAVDNALAEETFREKQGDLFSFAQTEDLSKTNNPVLKEFVAFINSDELRRWVAQVTKVRTTPGKASLFGAIYADSDYLLPHDDQLEDRKIAFIYYLTTLKKEEGGALAIYDEKEGHPHTITHRYQPEANALAFFTVSEESWHEVEEVTADAYRVSIGGWLHG